MSKLNIDTNSSHKIMRITFPYPVTQVGPTTFEIKMPLSQSQVFTEQFVLESERMLGRLESEKSLEKLVMQYDSDLLKRQIEIG